MRYMQRYAVGISYQISVMKERSRARELTSSVMYQPYWFQDLQDLQKGTRKEKGRRRGEARMQ